MAISSCRNATGSYRFAFNRLFRYYADIIEGVNRLRISQRNFGKLGNQGRDVYNAMPARIACQPWQTTTATRGSVLRKAVLVAAEGEPVLRYQDYIAQARLKEVGDSLRVEVLRDGQRLLVDVGLIEKPANSKVWRRNNFPGSEACSWEIPRVRPAGQSHDNTASTKPQLLYFWATWGGPCRQTSPEIDRLYRDASDRVDVVAVSSEERGVIDSYLAKSSTSYPIAHDSESRLKLDYEVQSLPTIVWLEGDKVVAWDYGVGGVRRVVSRLRTQLRI